jgi:GH35 family endo-1,4-beta-xylanase
MLGIAILATLVLSGCLRSTGAERGLAIGSAASAAYLGDAEYGKVLGREFALLTPENELKWDTIHPAQDRYDFGPADALVRYASEHSMGLRGVPLVWHAQNPAWLTDGQFTRSALLGILDEHIDTVVGRYSSVIGQWDVVNEAIDDSGQLRSTLWSKGIGPDYIEHAFRAARAADPDVKLFYNDYGIERSGRKADAVFALVSDLRQRGVPIDGVGFQAHLTTEASLAELQAQMNRYRAIGVDVAVTELDVRVPVPATTASLQAQAEIYRGVFKACLDATNCDTVVVWGFTDHHSWIPASVPGYGAATLFTEDYEPKPAYHAVAELLES